MVPPNKEPFYRQFRPAVRDLLQALSVMERAIRFAETSPKTQPIITLGERQTPRALRRKFIECYRLLPTLWKKYLDELATAGSTATSLVEQPERTDPKPEPTKEPTPRPSPSAESDSGSDTLDETFL
jgi:hypothetical protein